MKNLNLIHLPVVALALISFLALQNHCGLERAFSLLQNSHASMTATSEHAHCHGGTGSDQNKKTCSGEFCCTQIHADLTGKLPEIRLSENSVSERPLIDSKESVAQPFAHSYYRDVGPPHLSFHDQFYLEAFPSHAPPF